ncbi:MAG: hydantoinase B/oxoprolinase family protein, partial [Ignavibacteriales bacterium]
YFKTVTMEMLEEGRQFALRKAQKVLFPGRYRTPAINDVPFGDPIQRCRIPRDYIMHLPGEMTVAADGHITFDYDGASSNGYHSNNASWACSLGNHIYTLLQDVYYDGMFNNGLEDSFTLNIPPNSCNNASIEYACSAWAAAILSVSACVTHNLAMAYYATGFREEGFAAKAGTMAILAGGIDQLGLPFAVMNFEMNCSGMGASYCQDGLHGCNAPWNPESNLTDSEMFEHVWPLIWLGRGIQMDGGGFGRHRGGASIESLYVIEHDVGFVESGAIGSMDKVPVWGMMGGYPAPTRYKYALVDTDYADRVANMSPLPHGEGEDPANPLFAELINGTLKRYPGQQSSDQYKRYDILHQFSAGGGGWGDPIERDPQAVADDVALKVTSLYTANNVYCVALDPDTLEVDFTKTEVLRKEMRKKRLGRGISVAEYKKQTREKILANDIQPVPKSTYNDCFSRSEKFLNEFKEYWNLVDEFRGF